MTYPALPDEMAAVVANLEARPWTQGTMQDGRAVCAHGAVMTCRGLRPGDAEIIRAVMRARGATEYWNDEDGRTKDEVLQAMSQIAVTDDDLEQTFGPSWRLVVTVIRRAAALTEDEARRLADAGDAAWLAAGAAAGDAAWLAAGAAARDAAWVAARVAARDAAWAAAGDAARDAAVASCASDLAGQHGLTQAHLDTLWGPWVQVLGEDWAEGVMP
jgi:hypothetical protein